MGEKKKMKNKQARWLQLMAGVVLAGGFSMTVVAQSAPAAAPKAGAAKQQRILIIGDSLMKGLSPSLESELAKQPNVVTRACAAIGTGLARLDLYDWHAKLSEQAKDFKPDTAIVWIGGNDIQPLKKGDTVIVPGTPEWAAEYGQRVGLAMDILLGGGVKRIYWMELPDMRDSTQQANATTIRAIQEKEAKLRTEVTWMPVRTILSPTPGKYSDYVFVEGLPQDVRASDGLHLNVKGAKFLSAKLAPDIVR